MKIRIIALLLSLLCPLNSYAIETKASNAYLLDYNTSTVLFQKNADEKMVPSSMTKLMTVYLLFERLQNNILKLDDEFTVSEKAWRMGGSKTFLKHLERPTIETLLKGIIVQSGNDACVTVAEGISVDEESFANLMTKTGEKIGLTNSAFKNATGWPDEGHYMSAHDLGILAQEIIRKFPEYYHYFSIKEFEHNGIKQRNRNSLLDRDIGVDGLKTGHTDEGGYGMVVSAVQDGRRVIAVVNGLANENERADEAEKLINYGLRYFENKTLFKAGDAVSEAETWMAENETVALNAKNDITLLVPKLAKDDVKLEVVYNAPVIAPVQAGTEIAVLRVTTTSGEPHEFPLVAGSDVQKAGFAARLFRSLSKYFK